MCFSVLCSYAVENCRSWEGKLFLEFLTFGGLVYSDNTWSKNVDERPHRHLVTPREGVWIRPTFTPSNTCFLGPMWIRPLNGISIGLAVLAGLMNAANANLSVAIARILCNACVRCGLIILSKFVCNKDCHLSTAISYCNVIIVTFYCV